MRFTTSILAACATLAIAGTAQATTITNGDISMGLFDNGGLGSGGVGFRLAGAGDTGGDAIYRGCLCEGWGAAANGDGNHYVYGGSATGFTSAAMSDVTASSAKSTVVTSNGLTIVHNYSAVDGGTLFKIDVVITNTGGATATDVRYARTLDWDVAPGYFGENYTSIYVPGVAPEGNILHTSSNPFDTPNPMLTRSQEANTNISDSIGDKGSYFIFGFGDLEIGESAEFTTYIGAAFSVRTLLAAFGAVDVEAYSYTTASDRSTVYGYGFAGLGLPPIDDVPEPAALALFGLGVLGLGAARRRRKA
ncbi:PEP-CTERM sorting domain-containing protein [Sphingosinicella xenopeptidilytica]|uniref:PEP-CTERM sorting domain-containing protein n=1 Tax=Sphingosinicella xenopeptidilytica TaxID=364098 RepID=A0ABW3C243_SPHXN